MQVVKVEELPLIELPGATHRTLAGAMNGVMQAEIWLQTLEPGQATPMQRGALACAFRLRSTTAGIVPRSLNYPQAPPGLRQDSE